MKTLTMPEAVDALASIIEANGKLIPGKPAKNGTPATPPSVELTLTTDRNGPLVMTLEQFDDTYKGFVRCWPIVKPLKDQLATAMRQAAADDREARKAKEQAERDAAKAKAATIRAEAAKVLAESKAKKDEEKATAKAEKDASDKAAKEAKAQAKADKDAADAKAKSDKEKAEAKTKAAATKAAAAKK